MYNTNTNTNTRVKRVKQIHASKVYQTTNTCTCKYSLLIRRLMTLIVCFVESLVFERSALFYPVTLESPSFS
jgi:hypothetical protein